jgi:hypothetical protein
MPCLTSVVALFVAVTPVAAVGPQKGFVSLFNGKDLTGWKATGKQEMWGADNGILYCKVGGGGWLMTDKEFGDFELRLEYKMPTGGNSGVGLRAPLQGDPAYAGMEIQLIDDEGWPGRLQPWQNTGAIYNVVLPRTINNKPLGQWNRMTIVAQGRRITVVNNGKTLVDANLDDHVKKHAKKHPGLLRQDGHLGLQSYNRRVEFRNIYLKRGDQPDRTGWVPLFNRADLTGSKLHDKPTGSPMVASLKKWRDQVTEVIAVKKGGKVVGYDGKLKGETTVHL